MANWGVYRTKIHIYPHPNNEVHNLELGDCNGYQVVIQKGLRKDGETVIFIPDKSILPDNPLFEPYKKYLSGPEKNRVKAVKLQKELSCGIILDDQEEFKDIPLGEHLGDKLGITEYQPPIPTELAGKVRPIGNIDTAGFILSRHDVEQFNVNYQEFQEGEQVLVTEKIHGSQVAIIKTATGERILSSKGLLKRSLTIDESDTNAYWRGARNTGIFDILDKLYPNDYVQIFGELAPCQKGFSYGFIDPTILYFRLEVNNKPISLIDVPREIRLSSWVPVVYIGPLDFNHVRTLREGYETVSGKLTHIREGIVVSPEIPRNSAKGGFNLMLKLINPAYKESGEEIS